jgi:hypothetical protein
MLYWALSIMPYHQSRLFLALYQNMLIYMPQIMYGYL